MRLLLLGTSLRVLAVVWLFAWVARGLACADDEIEWDDEWDDPNNFYGDPNGAAADPTPHPATPAQEVTLQDPQPPEQPSTDQPQETPIFRPLTPAVVATPATAATDVADGVLSPSIAVPCTADCQGFTDAWQLCSYDANKEECRNWCHGAALSDYATCLSCEWRAGSPLDMLDELAAASKQIAAACLDVGQLEAMSEPEGAEVAAAATPTQPAQEVPTPEPVEISPADGVTEEEDPGMNLEDVEDVTNDTNEEEAIPEETIPEEPVEVSPPEPAPEPAEADIKDAAMPPPRTIPEDQGTPLPVGTVSNGVSVGGVGVTVGVDASGATVLVPAPNSDATLGASADPAQAAAAGGGAGLVVDPTTGATIDPTTGAVIDPATGMPMVDPATGLPVDPMAMAAMPDGSGMVGANSTAVFSAPAPARVQLGIISGALVALLLNL